MSTSTINQMNKPLYEQVVFERRILLLCTLLTGVTIGLWLAALSTDYWFYVDGGEGIYIAETKRFFIKSHSGLFRICRFEVEEDNQTKSQDNATNTTHPKPHLPIEVCKLHEIFPSDVFVKADPAIDHGILDYTRTEMAFGVIALMLSCMTFAFCVYTFRNPRYMFKRLSGGVQFLTAGVVLVVIEVLVNSVEYERMNLHFTIPPGATVDYGYSIFLAWSVFGIHLSSGCAFMLYSKKRKGSKAPNDELAMADEPTIIGR